MNARTLLELHIKRQIRFLQLELQRLEQEAARPPAESPAPALAEPTTLPAAPEEDWMRAALDDVNYQAWIRLKRDGVL